MSDQQIKQLGLDPEFFPDTEVDPDCWESYPANMQSCVFCQRDREHVPRLIISGSSNHAICSDCVDEINAVLGSSDAYSAWRAEQERKFAAEDPEG